MTAAPSIGDYLLRWASERGSGPWGEYRDAAASVLGHRSQNTRPWQLAHNISILGHVDVDWDKDQWSVARPCIALSPGMGLWAYLAGWRTHSLMDRFEHATDRIDAYPSQIGQGLNPSAQLVKVGSIAVLEQIAKELHVPIAYDPAAQLADLVALPKSNTAALSSAPPFDEQLEFFDPVPLRWTESNFRDLDGLYRFELHGRKQFRLLVGDQWFRVDRSVGQMSLLAARDDILVWHKPTADGSQPSVLAVRAGISLPVLAERAAVAATGLLPKHVRGWTIYQNVNRNTADRIANGLGLRLGFANDSFIVHPSKD